VARSRSKHKRAGTYKLNPPREFAEISDDYMTTVLIAS
jgi:hypothetical protein